MDMKEAQRISEIVSRYKQFEDFLCEFEDVISGHIEDFTVETANGSITIPSDGIETFGNRVLFEINGLFLERLEQIEKELNDCASDKERERDAQ